MRPGRGTRVVTLFGIDIGVDRSLLLMSALLIYLFFQSYKSVPALQGIGGEGFAALAAMSTLLFLVSLVAHELSHALVARRKGIEVAAITLFIFGGVAYIKQEPKRPGDEFLIAGAGPLLSVVLSGFFFGIGWLAALNDQAATAALFQDLGFVNATLAVFNMAPGFPLDGGRILRAGIWKLTGNVVTATRVASFTGYLLAGAVAAAGVYRFVWTGDFLGLWYVLMGAFLAQAARGSYRQVLMRQSLDTVTVEQLMTKDPKVIPANITLEEAVDRFFLPDGYSVLPVVGYGGRLEGLLSFTRVREIPGAVWNEVLVRQAMFPASPAVVAEPGESASGLLQRMAENPVGAFAVVAGEDLIGILSAADLARRVRGVGAGA